MKKFNLTIPFYFIFNCLVATNLNAQVEEGCVNANFGIDADVSADTLQFGGLSGAVGTDDWFANSGTGIGVIDTAGASALKNTLQTAATSNDRNISFIKNMAYPMGTVLNGNQLISATYVRDYFGNDSTSFISDGKNAKRIDSWNTGLSSVDTKLDLIDVFAHLRRDGQYFNDDYWLFGGASVLVDIGTTYNIEFEILKSGLGYDLSSNSFNNLGADATHTSWSFLSNGSTNSSGDILITFNFSGNSGTPIVEAYVWVDPAQLPGGSLSSFNTLSNRPFNFDGVFETISGSGNTLPYGYAKIEPLNNSITSACGITSSASTNASPWGTLTGSSGSFESEYAATQNVEIGINLSHFGLAPVQENICPSDFASLLVKTRNSNSFTSSLEDFVAPFPLTTIWAPIPDTIDSVCEGENISLSAYAISGATYNWSGPNGFSSTQQNPNIDSITNAQAGTYMVTATKDGCTELVGSTEVSVILGPIADASQYTLLGNGRAVKLNANATGGAGNYTFNWQVLGENSSYIVTPWGSSTYTLQVTDGIGCSDIDTVTIDLGKPKCSCK